MNRRLPALLPLLLSISFFLFTLPDKSHGQPSGKEKGPPPATSIPGPGPGSPEKSTGASPEKKTADAPAVEISPEKQKLIGIRTVAASANALQKTIRAAGRIDYDESRLATVTTRSAAWIDRLHADHTGKRVRKGEPLAEVYSPELISAEQEYLFSERCYRYKKVIRTEKIETFFSDQDIVLCRLIINDVESRLWQQRLKLRTWDVTEENLKEMAEKGAPPRTVTVRSPIDGYIVQKYAVQGKRVEPGEKLFDIADLSSVYVVADVFAHELPFIGVNQPARITLSFFPGKEFLSKVDLVYPAFSGETRTARVRFTLPNPDGRLKPQMFTTVGIRIDLGKKLSIPEEAVIDTGARQVVYVAHEGGMFEPRQVTLGVRAGGLVEVTRGLQAGEKVAASANFLIDSEAKLKGITE